MKHPATNYWTWTRVIPQALSFIALTMAAWLIFSFEQLHLAVLAAAGMYLVYSRSSRRLIPRSHRRGVAAMARKEYEEAISHFQQSYDFFSKHEWLDDFRSITMMSPSVWSYREIALMNIAATYAVQGDVTEAKQSYQRVLNEYPNNEIAANTLRLIEAASESNEA